MITGFTLGNFKAFGETQDMPLRPITLVFGPDNGGKSGIIHGLLLGRRIPETGEVDLRQATFQDQVLDLGGFRQYVHRHDLNRQVRWGIEVRPSAAAPRREVVSANIEIADCREHDAADGLPNVAISSLEISVGHQCLMRLGHRANGSLGPDYVNLQHPMLNTPDFTESHDGESLPNMVSLMYDNEEAVLKALSDMWETTSLHAQSKHMLACKPSTSLGLGSLPGGFLFGAAGVLLAPIVASAMSKKK